MSPREERRLLEFVYTTEAPVTPGSVAYALGCSVDSANQQLDRMVQNGVLRLDVSDDGDLVYTAPGRTELATSSAERPAIAPPPPPGAPVMNVGGVAPAPTSADQPSDVTGGDKGCPFCGETILAVARKCKHCGELLDPALRAASAVHVNGGVQNVAPAQLAPQSHLNPGTAAVLAFLWPGAGHMYCGRVGTGLALMFFTFIGYLMLLLPGMILHLVSIFSAAALARRGG